MVAREVPAGNEESRMWVFDVFGAIWGVFTGSIRGGGSDNEGPGLTSDG